jgi:hypothetical protein
VRSIKLKEEGRENWFKMFKDFCEKGDISLCWQN